jgi:hypothetical protein
VPADVVDFAEIGLTDVGRVGGKNASLGELFRALKARSLFSASTAIPARWHISSTNGTKQVRSTCSHDHAERAIA